MFILLVVITVIMFSKVRIAGVVKDAKEQDGGQSVEYKIADDAESNERFLVIHYRGVVSIAVEDFTAFAIIYRSFMP